MGNPLSYRDGMSFAWENGRNLKTISTGDNTVTMKYDSNGMRTQKQDDDYTTDYYYDSNNNLIGLSVGNEVLYFYYDTDGNVTGFSHNGTKYYYVKNLQGDVEKIADQEGNIVITYTYDAWGNLLNKTDTTPLRISNFNPYRYRSYMYDNETGLYYLKSRYYDPVTGRFINADIYCDTGSNILGTNMFTYCNNNIVNQIDPEGTDAIWLQFPNGVNCLGHTSLLVQDAYNTWWYFYWGDKHMYLRSCGKKGFNTDELNAYLGGFDPRSGRNYFVYAINAYSDQQDPGYDNYKKKYEETFFLLKPFVNKTDYFHKIHDGLIKGTIYFRGDFSDSYNYCYRQIAKAAGENISGIIYTYLEGDKKTILFHVSSRYYDDEDEMIKYNAIPSYNFIAKNCVQQVITALKHSKRVSSDYTLWSILSAEYYVAEPNFIFIDLCVKYNIYKFVNYKIEEAVKIIESIGDVEI